MQTETTKLRTKKNSELNNSGANRREEYVKIAQLFRNCETLEEAHQLSTVVFGIEKPLHLKGDIKRENETGEFKETKTTAR